MRSLARLMPPIYCVVSLGRGRGKTQLIESLITGLSGAGIEVATVKHSREMFDVAGKDSYRHLEAGAIEVAVASPSELITIRRAQPSLEDALTALHAEADLILVEGFKGSPHPKILCAEDEREAEEALKALSNVRAVVLRSPKAVEAVSGVRVMGYDEVLELLRREVIEYWVRLVPGLDCGRCGYGSCRALREAIRRGEASIRECVMRGGLVARVRVDGEEIPLGPWPQQLLRELVKAFAASLKLGEELIRNAERIVVEVRLRD